MDLDQHLRNLDHAHVGWHPGADADREVDAIDSRHAAVGQDGLPDLRALLFGQRHAAAGLTLLRLTLRSLTALRLLSLRLLALLPLRSRPLGLIALTRLRL